MPAGDFYVEAAAWSQIVASVLFIAVLIWLWVKFLQPAVMAAQVNANKQIAEAERHRDEAKATVDVLKNESSGAATDAEAIKVRAGEQAVRELEASVAQAREAGERALQNARGEYDRAIAANRERLRGDLLDKALVRARTEAKRRVDAAANERLVDGFVASIERSSGAVQSHG